MRVVVITGSTRGIGYALAEYFLDSHCKVVINGTTDESVNRAIKSLGVFGKSDFLAGVSGDVAEYETHMRLVKKAMDTFGRLDIWINNAGIDQEDELFFEHDNDKLKRVFDVNVHGVVFGSKAACNAMAATSSGYIYNMEGFGSDGRMMPKLSIYGASKRAVRYVTYSMAREIEGTGVRIGTLSPGMVATDFLKESLKKGDAEAIRRKRVYNILADEPKVVAQYLGGEVLANRKNNAKIAWLTMPKILLRFMTARFNKRDLFGDFQL